MKSSAKFRGEPMRSRKAKSLPCVRVSCSRGTVLVPAWLVLTQSADRWDGSSERDALSEAVNPVRMMSAIFFNAELGAPWGFTTPPTQQVASILAPGTEALVPYHLVTAGKAIARVAGVADVPLKAGDIVILPH